MNFATAKSHHIKVQRLILPPADETAKTFKSLVEVFQKLRLRIRVVEIQKRWEITLPDARTSLD